MIRVQLLSVFNVAALLTSVHAAWHQAATEALSNTGVATNSEDFLETRESDGTVEERRARRDSMTITGADDLFDWPNEGVIANQPDAQWHYHKNLFERTKGRSDESLAMDAVKEALTLDEKVKQVVTTEKLVENAAAVEAMLPRLQGGRVLAIGISLLVMWLFLEGFDWSPSDAVSDPHSPFGKVMEILDTLVVIAATLGPGLIKSGAGQLYISYKTRELLRAAALEALTSSRDPHVALERAATIIQKGKANHSLSDGVWQVAFGLILSVFTLHSWDAFADTGAVGFAEAFRIFAPVGLLVHGLLILTGKLWNFSKVGTALKASGSGGFAENINDYSVEQAYEMSDEKLTNWI